MNQRFRQLPRPANEGNRGEKSMKKQQTNKQSYPHKKLVGKDELYSIIEAKGTTSGELALTEKEIKLVFSQLNSLRDEVLIKLAVCIGARRADIVRIQRDLIDIPNLRITYLESKKGDKPHSAPISPEMSRLINMYLKESRKSKYLFPSAHSTDNRLGHINGRTAWNVFNRALDDAGLKRRKFHSLRATCVKHAQRMGWEPPATAKLINDKVETVLKHYSTPSRDEMNEVSAEKPLIV